MMIKLLIKSPKDWTLLTNVIGHARLVQSVNAQQIPRSVFPVIIYQIKESIRRSYSKTNAYLTAQLTHFTMPLATLANTVTQSAENAK